MAAKRTEEPSGGAARQKRCFLITPIGGEKSPVRQHADWVYYHVVEPLFRERGYRSSRADLISDPFMINDSVFQAITEADICVADLTTLNANVFYELGVRHTLVQPVIHIAQVDTVLPFDNAGYRTIFFDRQDFHSMEFLRGEIAKQIDAIEGPAFQPSNPLTQYRGRELMAESADSRDQVIASLQDQVAQQGRALRELQASLLERSRNALSSNSTWVAGDDTIRAASTLGSRQRLMPIVASAIGAAQAASSLSHSALSAAQLSDTENATRSSESDG